MPAEVPADQLPTDDLLHVLRQTWGHAAFRPGQEDIIRHVLAGHDALALLPTGGGKSICFQVPALARPGLCLVVSPLIALMRDQVENLRQRGVRAEAIYAGMSHQEIDQALDNCVYGPVKFLYVSPERLLTDLFRVRVVKMNVTLLAVDEAHCLSQWGYDFRPPYLRIVELRALLPPGTPVIALTATATAQVQADIVEKLTFGPQHAVFGKALPGPSFPTPCCTPKTSCAACWRCCAAWGPAKLASSTRAPAAKPKTPPPTCSSRA
jgi:ATP-dependent DNA helicase RecQ